MTISMIIFDYDGTLVDSLQIHVNNWRQILHEVGVDVPEAELRKRFGMTAKDILKEILPEHLKSKMVSIAKKESKLFTAKLSELRLMPKAKEVLDEIKSKLVPMAIATSIQKESLDKSLSFLGIKDYFDHVITGEEVSRGKPYPDIFLEVTKKASVRPESCLVVGDTVYDAEAAIRAGMKVIIVGSPAFKDKLLEMKVPIVENLQKILPYVFA
jgi:HAD superfamily hydrolase (TIGR01509 family)